MKQCKTQAARHKMSQAGLTSFCH